MRVGEDQQWQKVRGSAVASFGDMGALTRLARDGVVRAAQRPRSPLQVSSVGVRSSRRECEGLFGSCFGEARLPAGKQSDTWSGGESLPARPIPGPDNIGNALCCIGCCWRAQSHAFSSGPEITVLFNASPVTLVRSVVRFSTVPVRTLRGSKSCSILALAYICGLALDLRWTR